MRFTNLYMIMMVVSSLYPLDVVAQTPECTEDEFACMLGFTCIPYGMVCDGFADCLDFSDELPEICLTTATPSATTNSVECDYVCNDGLTCIPYMMLCDGVPDCMDASDESPQMCEATKVPTTSSSGCRLTSYLNVFTIPCSTDECVGKPCNGIIDCDAGNDEAPELCDFIDIRLVGGEIPSVGRVEVYFNGEWGSICDDGWSQINAGVVCRQLGFSEGNHQPTTAGVFDSGGGPTWLDGVSCIGTENNIGDCSHSGWGNHDCNHQEDAGVICFDDGCRLSAYDGLYDYYDYSGPFVCDTGDCIAIPCNGEAECEDSSDEALELCDDVNPVISNVPDTILAYTDRGKPFASVQWVEPTASDNSQSVTLTADYKQGDQFPIGDTVVTYTAIDKSGNNITAKFNITVRDNEPPSVMSGCPVYIEKFTDKLSLNVSWTSPIFYDNSGMMVEQNSTDMSPLMFALGRHMITYHAWDPFGNIASCSITINITAACLETSAILTEGHFTWPISRAENQYVDSNERCDVNTEERGKGLAVRVCMFNEENGGSEWLTPEYVGCGEDDEPDLSELSETDVVEDNVENVAEALNNVTKELVNPDADDIENIADTFTNIVNVEVITPEVTVAVVGIISNLHTATNVMEDKQDTDTDDDNSPNQMNANAPHLLEILVALEDQITRTTTSLGGQPLQVVEPNIALTTVPAPQRGTNTGLSFVVVQSNIAGDQNGFQDEDVKTLANNEDLPLETRTSISLPASLFNTTGNDTVGVSFFVQNSDTLFPTNSTNQTVGGDVMSAIVVGIPNVSNLSEPVVLEFTALGENPSCVSWDFNISDWSDNGCLFVNYTDNGRVICHCDHLTNFAVLVDPFYDTAHFVLDIISKIGCGLSMVSLSATILIFIVFRRLRIGAQATPRKILIQLCIALFCLYLVFLVGIDQVSNRNGCIFVSTLLQFFTLASLMWMAVEAHNLYLNIVTVFDAQPAHFVLKMSIIAWGIPLLVSVISAGAGFHPYYDHLDYCFSTGPPLYYGIVLPIAIILVHNLITFSLVMHRLCKARLGGNVTKQSQTQKMIRRLQNAFAISVLMGLTWVLGFLAIGDAKFIVSLLFCICNSFQGFAVFLLFCVRQDDVRKTLRPYFGFICCHQADKHRSQTSSTLLRSTVKSSTNPSYNATDFTAIAPQYDVPPTTKVSTGVTETNVDIESPYEQMSNQQDGGLSAEEKSRTVAIASNYDVPPTHYEVPSTTMDGTTKCSPGVTVTNVDIESPYEQVNNQQYGGASAEEQSENAPIAPHYDRPPTYYEVPSTAKLSTGETETNVDIESTYEQINNQQHHYLSAEEQSRTVESSEASEAPLLPVKVSSKNINAPADNAGFQMDHVQTVSTEDVYEVI